jgi:hypothetical protein
MTTLVVFGVVLAPFPPVQTISRLPAMLLMFASGESDDKPFQPFT